MPAAVAVQVVEEKEERTKRRRNGGGGDTLIEQLQHRKEEEEDTAPAPAAAAPQMDDTDRQTRTQDNGKSQGHPYGVQPWGNYLAHGSVKVGVCVYLCVCVKGREGRSNLQQHVWWMVVVVVEM
jgi:hypothetical protein